MLNIKLIIGRITQICLLFSILIKIECAQARQIHDEDMILKGKRISFYTPHLLNPKFFGFEFGFVVQKYVGDYPYHAFAKAVVAEEFFTVDQKNRGGALGVKAGLLLPTQPWLPLFLELAFGYAKTAFQEDPWFGGSDVTLQNDDLLLAEIGLIYRFGDKFLVRANYQVNNVDYFDREVFMSVGFNY